MIIYECVYPCAEDSEMRKTLHHKSCLSGRCVDSLASLAVRTFRWNMHKGMMSGEAACCSEQAASVHEPCSHLKQTVTQAGSWRSLHWPFLWPSHLPVLHHAGTSAMP